MTDVDPELADLPVEFGPFRIIESGVSDTDFVLTDTRESVLFGFTAEEAADLQVVAERLVSQIETGE